MIDLSDSSAGPSAVVWHNGEAEASILGGIILRNDALDRVQDLNVGEFFDNRHRVVFSAMRNLAAASRPIDIVLLENEIERAGKLDAIGGVAFLGDLTMRVPTVDNVEHYKHVVKMHARNRAAQVALGSALERAKTWPHDPLELISETIGELQQIERSTPQPSNPWNQEIAQALADVKNSLGSAIAVKREPLFVNIQTLFATSDEQTPWQITGLVTRGGTATLGAEPKTCKTWVATEFGVAVATGTKAFGEYFAERGTVAYFYAEDRPNEVRNRIRALAKSRNIDPTTITNLHVCPRGKFVDVTKDEDLAWIIASCRRIGRVDLVILDPLRDIHTASEDKSDEMAPVMKRLRLVGELLKATVMVSHHAAKSSESTAKRRPGQRMRGSSVIHGSTDSGIYLALNEGEDGGDSVGTFVIEADVEIKGARSAGALTITLELQDDANGAAVGATWIVSKRGDKRKKAAAIVTSKDDRLHAAVLKIHASGRRESCTARSVRAIAGVHPRDVQAGLDRLVAAGRLWLEEIQRSEPGPNGKSRTMYQTIYAPVVGADS